MDHPLTMQWEKQLKKLFDQVDDYLEDNFGSDYSLHPNRAYRGSTSNKEHDGLFNVGASFSSGFGAKYGRGYVIDVHISTLDEVPKEAKDKIINEAVHKASELLPIYFPNRDLKIVRDGNVFKISGDFKLGKGH